MTNSSNGDLIDKDYAYGEFQRTQRWRDSLSRKLAHKALDIPDDEMDIKIQKGITWKEILAIGALALAGSWAWLESKQQPPPSDPPAAVDHDTTRRIDIEKYIPPDSLQQIVVE